jgi:hypothetical protein
MNSDEDGFRLYQKAFRPKPDTIIGPDRRFRDPAVQAEIERRVAVYAEQVARQGAITRWLPRRGNGQSAKG